MAVVPSSQFHTPLRYIFDAADLRCWTQSKSYEELLKFVSALNTSTANKPISAPVDVPPAAAALVSILEDLEKLVDTVPPLAQSMRYGNKAFRDWHGRVAERAAMYMRQVLGGLHNGAERELVSYFCDSFGNPTRIDYGTGHETTFIVLLYCIFKLGVCGTLDLPALGLRVFPAYIALCRKLQRTYFLEPAGSHGVWSLDDYQFLVFLFGSSQLLDNPHIRPRSIHTSEVVEGHKEDYLYLAAVSFVNSVKTGAPFAEHSPVLNDISELSSWHKVNEGLAKMYKVEVLSKLPVVQHFVFGSIFPASWTSSREPVPSESMSHFLQIHARGPHEAALAARLAEASSSVVPTDEGSMAVAPWITEPIPARDLASAGLSFARRHSGSGNELTDESGLDNKTPAASETSTVDAFLGAFGPIPHVSPAERHRLSLGGDETS